MAVILIAIWLMWVALTVSAARKRNREPWVWGVLALLTGCFALLAIYILPPHKTAV